MRQLALRLCVTVLGLACVGESARAQGATFPPFLELRVPKPPTVGAGDQGAFLVYELHITNFSGQPNTIRKVEVVSDDAARRVMLTVDDTALEKRMMQPGRPNTRIAERPTIGPDTRVVVYLWVPVDASSPPVSLRNRVTVAVGTGDSASVQTLEGPSVPVTRNAVVIGPMLRGGPWLAANGPSNESGHRRALLPVGGVPAIAQRYAIDWVKIGEDGKTFTGDRLNNANYHAEGNDALAVADGRVVEVKDGIPENIPGANSRAVPITLETVGGNHVVIDIGGGHFAFYAHLKPGSLRVKEGDQVHRGQVLGLVGNTGNSTEPHLHFHISDGISPLGSEGLPYVINDLDIVGHCKSLGGNCDRGAAVRRHGEMPLSNVLVQFP